MARQSERLKVVLELEQRREQAALEQFQAAQEALRQQTDRLAELERYQGEYQQQLRNDGAGGPIPVSRLQTGQAFISQLSQAISGQQMQVRQAHRRFDEARREWQKAWERREGMARFIETCRERERREDERREQKAMDEATSQHFARRRK